MIKYLLIVVLMTMLGALGAYFFKLGSARMKGLFSLFKIKDIYIGVFFYVSAALLNVYVLIYLPYSIVLPFTAISYIWSTFIASLFLKEKITSHKVIGLCLIVFGAVLLGIASGAV